MAILYVAAEAAELEPLAQIVINGRKLKWPLDYAFEGILNGKRLLLTANGAGPRLSAHAVEVATRALSVAELSASKLEAVVSTGFCGALDPALREEQIIVATSVTDAVSRQTGACEPPDAEGCTYVSGPLISQDRIASTAEEKRRLADSGAIAVEMEAAGVLARTKRAGLPLYCIKVVSDRADESFGFDLNTLRTTDGRISRGKIGRYAVSHPSVVPELLRLRRRSDRAAKALGEFLASCRIKPEQDSVPVE